MTAAGRRLDLQLHLLDRQVVDPNGRLVGKVDDLELVADEQGRLLVTGILLGPRALGPRLGTRGPAGWLGRWLTALATRLSTPERRDPPRIDFSLVTGIGSAVTVARTRSELDVAPLEAWVDQHVIGRIPGAGDAGE